jgi:hypothetical protein
LLVSRVVGGAADAGDDRHDLVVESERRQFRVVGGDEVRPRLVSSGDRTHRQHQPRAARRPPGRRVGQHVWRQLLQRADQTVDREPLDSGQDGPVAGHDVLRPAVLGSTVGFPLCGSRPE